MAAIIIVLLAIVAVLVIRVPIRKSNSQTNALRESAQMNREAQKAMFDMLQEANRCGYRRDDADLNDYPPDE